MNMRTTWHEKPAAGPFGYYPGPGPMKTEHRHLVPCRIELARCLAPTRLVVAPADRPSLQFTTPQAKAPLNGGST